MAAFNITRSRMNDKPGRKCVRIEGTFNGNDTTATLQLPKGNLVDFRGNSVGTTSNGNAACSDTPTNGMISCGGTINITRDEGASGTAYFLYAEYDSI